MELGLHIADFAWNGGTPELGATLGRLAVGAEDAGVARLTVMDHVWQIGGIGPPEDPMLEAYTTLGYLAGVTRQVRLHALVTAVVYREPGLLAKMVTTLDVLSGGRAGLGIGAAWNEDESRGLGLLFPSTRERFERLDEAVRICEAMWSDADAPFEGVHYQLDAHAELAAERPASPALADDRRLRRAQDAASRRAARRCLQHLRRAGGRVTSSRSCAPTASGRGATTTRSRRRPCSRSIRRRRATTCSASLRGVHDIGFTVAYIFGKNPEPLRTVELLSEVVPEISAW